MGKEKRKEDFQDENIANAYSVDPKQLAEVWGVGAPTRADARADRKRARSHKGIIALCICGAALVAVCVTLLATMPFDDNSSPEGGAPSDDPGVVSMLSGAAGSVLRPSSTAFPTTTATAPPTPEPTPEMTAEPTPEPTEEPTPTPPPIPDPDLSNSVIIGNSTTEALYIYGPLSEADFLYGTGLTVDSVFTETMPDASIPIIDELKGQNYDKIFLCFGLNELGWPNPQIFMEHYERVIDQARAYQPNAEIYIESVLPVGKARSDRNEFGVTQDKINEFNVLLEQMAQDVGAHFLDVTTGFKNEEGYMPEEYASDGVHPNKEGSDLWAQLLVEQIKETMA